MFCNLDWARPTTYKGKKTGEIDFIVAAPGNKLHIIELSLGRLELDGLGNLVFKSISGTKNKSAQLNSNKNIIIELLKRARDRAIEIPPQQIEGWLLLPNSRISPDTVLLRYPEDHIVDRSSSANPVVELGRRIIAESRDVEASSTPVSGALIKLLSQELGYVPDVSSLTAGELSYTTTMNETSELILTAETRAPMIVVDGVAGSGKTQLALIGLSRCKDHSLKACLIANTRVIPNLLRREVGDEKTIYSYQEFLKCDHRELDQVFIDEAHHFNQHAVSLIASRLAPDGRIFALMDSAQNFDERFMPGPNATIFHFNTSHRVPAKLCDLLSQLNPLQKNIRSTVTDVDTYFDLQVSDSSLTNCLALMAKFFLDKKSLLWHAGIVYCGSKFELQKDLFANIYKLKAFLEMCGFSPSIESLTTHIINSRFDIDTQHNDFGITIDTIRRWQGTAKPIIFACNLKKQANAETACRLFYSCATRARSRCEVLATPAFAKQILEATDSTFSY